MNFACPTKLHKHTLEIEDYSCVYNYNKYYYIIYIRNCAYLVSPERAHSVGFSEQEIFLSSDTMLSIEWSPEQLVPESLLSTDITVDISLYIQQ